MTKRLFYTQNVLLSRRISVSSIWEPHSEWLRNQSHVGIEHWSWNYTLTPHLPAVLPSLSYWSTCLKPGPACGLVRAQELPQSLTLSTRLPWFPAAADPEAAPSTSVDGKSPQLDAVLFFFLKVRMKDDKQPLLKLGEEKTNTILVIQFVWTTI